MNKSEIWQHHWVSFHVNQNTRRRPKPFEMFLLKTMPGPAYAARAVFHFVFRLEIICLQTS